MHYQITEHQDSVAMVASSLGKIKVSVEMANKKGDKEMKLKQEQEEKERQRLAEKKVINTSKFKNSKNFLTQAKEDAKKAAIAASMMSSL